MSQAPIPASTVFRPARVVVGADGEVRRGVVVVVEDGRIAYVGPADGVAGLAERTVVEAPGADRVA